MILVAADAMLLRGWGSRLSLITPAVLVWVPVTVATAVIVTVTRPPRRSVPSAHVSGGPARQLPCTEWIETSLTGSLGVSVSLTPVAAWGPRLVTVIVYVSRYPDLATWRSTCFVSARSDIRYKQSAGRRAGNWRGARRSRLSK